MHLSLLVECFVPTKVIRVRNKDKPWFNGDYRREFDLKQEAHLRWSCDRSRVNCDEFVQVQRRANEVYAETRRQFSIRNRDILMNTKCPHKWWSTLKSAVLANVHALLANVTYCALHHQAYGRNSLVGRENVPPMQARRPRHRE